MARWMEPNAAQEAAWAAWVAERPEPVRVVAERFEPWSLYRMKEMGHRVTIECFDEPEEGPVTVKVRVSGDFNLIAFERVVFGVDPDSLEPCDLPSPDEPLGVALTASAE